MNNDLVGGYVAHRAARRELAPSSAEAVRWTLRQWHHHAGPVDRWTDELATDWCLDMRLRPATRKMRRGRLRPYTAWLTAQGVLDVDVAERVPAVRVPLRAPRNLERDAVTRLLDVCPDVRATLIVLLMVQCGLRCVDVSRVRVEDVDVVRRRLDVRAKGGGGDVTHTVPVPVEAWRVLSRFVAAEGRSSGPLICNSRRCDPVPVSAHHLGALVRGWMRDADLKVFPFDGVSAHALRHTCAQDMLDHGAGVREVQHALGHRTSSTTELFYLRSEPAGLAGAMEGRWYLRSA